MSDIKKVENDLHLLKNDLSTKFEKLFTMMNTLQQGQNLISEDLKSLKQRVENLDGSVAKAHQNIDAVYNEQRNLRAQVNYMEQQKLINSVNIFGLPCIPQDQAMATVTKIAKEMGMNVKQPDMKDVYVVKHSDNISSHISAKFYDERKRDEILSAFKKRITDKKPVLVENICNLPNNSKLRGTEIRIRTALTQETRKLLAMARKFSHQFEFIWETDGRVLMKKHRDSKTIEIKSECHLLSVTQSSTGSQASNFMEM